MVNVLINAQFWILADSFKVLLKDQTNLRIENSNIKDLICLNQSNAFNKIQIFRILEVNHPIEWNQRDDVLDKALLEISFADFEEILNRLIILVNVFSGKAQKHFNQEDSFKTQL